MVIKVLLLTILILAVSFIGFAISILIKKNGRFPELHIGANKDLKKKGIACATSQDKMEQLKLKKSIHFKQLTILDKEFDKL